MKQIPPASEPGPADPDGVWLGVAIAPDNRALYVSEGENGRVGIFDLLTRQRLGTISLDGTSDAMSVSNSVTGDLKLSADGRLLYVLELAHFRLTIVDTQSKTVLASLRVGRMPFGLAVSPDGKRVYVSNVGMFEYSLIPGYDSKDARHSGLDFPPFGFPSKEALEGTTVSGRKIPGLGDPNVVESNSVWVIDVSNAQEPRVSAQIRTGTAVGSESVGGSSPGAVVAGGSRIYVSNAAQDSVTIIDAQTDRVERTVVLEPAASVRGLRGVMPFGMALSPNGKRLYVACSGINAVAVLDASKGRVLGYIPTAWFPARVAVSPDGNTLYVANAKGFGAGPNGGQNFDAGSQSGYIGDITKGVISIVSVRGGGSLKEATVRVLRNNGFAPVAPAVVQRGEPVVPLTGQNGSKIHHVVFVVKENRTFDEIFGDLEAEDTAIAGEPNLARWGDDVVLKEEGGDVLDHARVTPNHHALARRFAISDNFYVDADVSVDGHHWLVGNYPNELVESTWPPAYGHKFHFRPDPDAPGRIGIGSANPWPESFLEAGSLWEHLARHGISFRNYGEGNNMAGYDEGPGLMPTGIREAVNIPMPQVLFENTSRDYATFNTNISDQYRFDQFQREFALRYVTGKEPMPQFIYIWLPNDHTAEPRPGDGYPYRASYVADNDLALGKLVALFSHSAFWKDMAIFVTEDDAQDGRDHVDAHRSLLMVISPYAHRRVSHVHTSIASILKTFNLIFGLPSLNQYDAAASDLADMLTDQPDFTAYDALPSDVRVFDPAKVREPGLELYAAPQASEPLDDAVRIRRRMGERH